jgi:hypothetical protein
LLELKRVTSPLRLRHLRYPFALEQLAKGYVLRGQGQLTERNYQPSAGYPKRRHIARPVNIGEGGFVWKWEIYSLQIHCEIPRMSPARGLQKVIS